MHAFAVVGTIVWFLLVAWLWYAKLGDLLWFAGSMALGIVYFIGFFRYVTRAK